MNEPIHVAITRRIKPGCEQEFQTALKEFFANSLARTGVYGAVRCQRPLWIGPQSSHSRPGSRVVISWSCHSLPSGSLNAA